MTHLIDKDTLVAEIEKCYNECLKRAKITDSDYWNAKADTYRNVLEILNGTLEVKEVDLDIQTFAKEMDAVFALPSSETKNTEEEPLNWEYAIAKHFFDLGMRVNNPITAADRGTAEEIIINLKRVEQDYHIDLTKEMEWVRNQIKKGE